MAKKSKRRFWFVTTDVRCSNPNIGQGVEKYNFGKMTAEEDRAFRGHLLACVYCSAMVMNFKEMKAASEYYGISVGPELDKHLIRVDCSRSRD